MNIDNDNTNDDIWQYLEEPSQASHDFLWSVLNESPEQTSDMNMDMMDMDMDILQLNSEQEEQTTSKKEVKKKLRERKFVNEFRHVFPSVSWKKKDLKKMIDLVRKHFKENISVTLVPKTKVIQKFVENAKQKKAILKLNLKGTRTLREIIEHLKEYWNLDPSTNIEFSMLKPKTWTASDENLLLSQLYEEITVLQYDFTDFIDFTDFTE